MTNTYTVYFKNDWQSELQSEKFTGTRAQIERAYDGKIITAVDDRDCAEAMALVARLQIAGDVGIDALTMDVRPEQLVTGREDCQGCPVKDPQQIEDEIKMREEAAIDQWADARREYRFGKSL